jgi:hypothetical protein
MPSLEAWILTLGMALWALLASWLLHRNRVDAEDEDT